MRTECEDVAIRVLIYGLDNCDGCRRARRWFAAEGFDFDARDIRDPARTREALRHIRACGDPAPFLNRRSATWRQLPAARKDDLNARSTLALLGEHPTLIKRPLLVIGAAVLAGFDEARVRAALTDG